MILEMLQAAGFPATTAAAMAGITWLGNKHVQRDKEREKEGRKEREAMEERLRALEIDRVVKADINRVYDRIEALGTDLRDQNAKNLELMLDALTRQPRR